MKKQIKRLSPHQNGKVFGVLFAVSSLLFLFPMFLMFSFVGPMSHGGAPHGPPAFFFLIAPIIYLIIGYISVAIGCLIYNFLFKYIGGIEFESSEQNI